MTGWLVLVLVGGAALALLVHALLFVAIAERMGFWRAVATDELGPEATAGVVPGEPPAEGHSSPHTPRRESNPTTD